MSKNKLGADRKANVSYFIETGEQYTIDSVSKKINSPALDYLYESSLAERLIQKGYPFEIDRFDAERTRLINFFRNPVNRAYSAYNHAVRYGWEHSSFENAIEA